MNWNNNFIPRFVLRCSAIIIYEYLRKNTGGVSKIFYPRFIPNIYTSPFPFYAVVFVDNKIHTNFQNSLLDFEIISILCYYVQRRSFLTTWASKAPRDGDYLFAGTKYRRRKLAISIFVRLFIDRADCVSTEPIVYRPRIERFNVKYLRAGCGNENWATSSNVAIPYKCIYLASRLSLEIFRIFRNKIRVDLNR